MKKILFAVVAAAAIFGFYTMVSYNTSEATTKSVSECVCDGCQGAGSCDESCSSTCEMGMSEFKKEPMKHSSGVSEVSGDVNDINDDTCPVSGEPLGENPKTVNYLGKEYKFCCPGCVAEFKEEPMDYIKEGINCPVEGGAASKDMSVMYEGTKYYFCCPGCDKEFLSNPDKYKNGNSSK